MGILFYLKKCEECDKNRFLYIGGDMICSFLTDDNIYINTFRIWEMI